jgi:hypothetical protein
LMIWPGARPEELAQLAPSDVVTAGDVLCPDIYDRGSNTLKTSPPSGACRCILGCLTKA